MKILWICNIALPRVAEYLHMEASNKEGWLTGLSDRLLEQSRKNDIELAVAFPVQEDQSKWEIPVPEYGAQLTAYGFVEDTAHPETYPEGLEERLRRIIEDFKPQVVHCFGTEFPHTLAATRVCEKEKILLGIQGLCAIYAKAYLADLPEAVIRRVTFRDLLRKDSIMQQQQKFEKRGEMEQEAIRNAGHVTGRTWIDKKYTADCNPRVQYHFMNETLRRNFYEGKWNIEQCEKHSIFLSQGDYPIKGLHYMLQAMPEILEKYPDAKVYVAGNCIVRQDTWKDEIKISSYGKYLLDLIKQYHLQDKIIFLGKMDAGAMKEQFLKSSLFVCPSTIENSPNSLGEAMLLGMPCVTANVGGIRSIFEDGRDGIAYPGFGADLYKDAPHKEQAQAKELARAVLQMWSDEEKMREYGNRAREHACRTHDGDENFRTLIQIYEKIAEGRA
ncbi:MAG: glycosyltransferase family 4 protein [Lachnospiraceae bacterium]|nr:glycosyltransferase family 4 protein [Lachnospiraceae bacterium]